MDSFMSHFFRWTCVFCEKKLMEKILERLATEEKQLMDEVDRLLQSDRTTYVPIDERIENDHLTDNNQQNAENSHNDDDNAQDYNYYEDVDAEYYQLVNDDDYYMMIMMTIVVLFVIMKKKNILLLINNNYYQMKC